MPLPVVLRQALGTVLDDLWDAIQVREFYNHAERVTLPGGVLIKIHVQWTPGDKRPIIRLERRDRPEGL